MRDQLEPVGRDGVEVARGAKNLVVLALWAPVVIILNGLAAALAIGAVRAAYLGEPADMAGALGSVDGGQAVLVAAAGLALLYYSLAKATFGDERVSGSVDELAEARDGVEGGDDA